MSYELQERSIDCPYCGEPLTILVDASAGDQHYVEDCQVCCRPIEISFMTDGDDVINLQARSDS